MLLIATPVWAYQWYRLPFLGTGLEQNNVVSQLDGADWPARSHGANFMDRLIALNDEPVLDIRDVERELAANGYQPIRAKFERPTGEWFTLTITPIRPPWLDVISLFIVPYLVGTIFLVIGLWAYRAKPHLWESRGLLLFASGVSIMLTTFLDISTTHHASILWSLAILQTSGGVMYLALVFPQPARFVRANPRLRYLPWLVLALLAPMMFIAIYRPPSPYFYIAAWQIGYVCMILGFFLFAGMLLWRVYRARSPIIRQQSRVILFGGFLAFMPILWYLGGLILGFLPNFHAWLYFPPLILFPLSLTYAILRYRLLDMDALLVRILTYALMTVIVITVFYGLIALLSFILQETVQASDPRIIASYLFLLVIGLTPLRTLIQGVIDRLFYRAPADYRRALSSLSRSLVITPNLNQTLRVLEEQIQQALEPEKFLAYLYNDDLKEYIPHATREVSAPPYQTDDPLIELLASLQGPQWFPPGGPLPAGLQKAADKYQRLIGSTFVPLHYEGNLIGFLSLGPRRSGDLYNSNDLDFLAGVGAQSTLALENARLFANLRRILDQTLEMKNLMDDIFASIATGVMTTDLQRRITLFNRAAEQIFGVPMKRAVGESLSGLLPGLGEELDRAASSVLEKNAATLNTEFNSHVPSRGDLYLRLSLSPLRDAYLETKGAAIVFEDLTEHRKVEAERELIRKTFGRVVAPRVRDRLLADPGNLKLDGVNRTVTILFADLSGFSTYSEKHTPETVFSLLNFYLSIAAQAILEQEGTLDKFMGDAVLAIWNSPDLQPDHAWRAVRAAMEIVRRSMAAHQTLEDAGQKMVFRIGVTTGPAIIGNVGTHELFNYTAIGDVVNVAQRLQTLAQGGEILLEKATYDIVADRVMGEALPPIMVKGREQFVDVFKLKGLK